MWIFGAMTKDELEQAQAQGWQFERELTPEEVDQFVKPGDTGVHDETDDVYALFYVESDVFENLNAWYQEANAYAELDRQKKLQDNRRGAANLAWEEYDFWNNGDLPEDSEIFDCEGWETDGEDRLTRLFYYSDPAAADGPSLKGTFIVEFKHGTAQLVEFHASM